MFVLNIIVTSLKLVYVERDMNPTSQCPYMGPKIKKGNTVDMDARPCVVMCSQCVMIMMLMIHHDNGILIFFQCCSLVFTAKPVIYYRYLCPFKCTPHTHTTLAICVVINKHNHSVISDDPMSYLGM